MTPAEIIQLALQASIWLIVFALGLRADLADIFSVLRRPGLLLRSLAAMMIVMPLVAVALVRLLPLEQAVAAALIALSLAPVPPLLPKKQVKAGGDSAYSVGLLVAASLVAIIWIPIAIELIDRIASASLRAPAMAIARLLLTSLFAPLAAGLIVRRILPKLSERASKFVSMAGLLLLLAAVIPAVFAAREAIVAQIGDGTLLAFAAFFVAGLIAGHVFGGPTGEHRTVLAMACASRHPGVAIALASMNFPDNAAIPPAVLLYLLTTALISLPYVAWRKRADA